MEWSGVEWSGVEWSGVKESEYYVIYREDIWKRDEKMKR